VGGHEECVGRRADGDVDGSGDVAGGVLGGFADICAEGESVSGAKAEE